MLARFGYSLRRDRPHRAHIRVGGLLEHETRTRQQSASVRDTFTVCRSADLASLVLTSIVDPSGAATSHSQMWTPAVAAIRDCRAIDTTDNAH